MRAHGNPWQAAARAEKALKIAALLAGAGIPPELARRQTQQEWIQTAACAGCMPPSEETRELVIETLDRFRSAETQHSSTGA